MVPVSLSTETATEQPLSYGQRSLWFLQQLNPMSAAYNVSFAIRIVTGLDLLALERAFQTIVDRHQPLRATFTTRGGEPVQLIHDHLKVRIGQIDATAWSLDELNERLVEEAHRPFDLALGPMMRLNLYSRSTGGQILLMTIHHIAIDLWSIVVLTEELRRLYGAEVAGEDANLPLVRTQYSDYADWQAEMLRGERGEQLWSYWQKQLSGELPVLNLPTDRPRPPVQTYSGESFSFKLNEETSSKIKALARGEGATTYMALLAALQILLHRYSGQEDILVGSPVAGRNRAKFRSIIGYFVNSAVMRGDLSGRPTYREFLRRIRETVKGALDHQNYPFSLLVERLQSQRDPSRSPLFQVMFVLEKPHRIEELSPFVLGQEGARMDLGGMEVEPVALEQKIAPFDLGLVMVESKGLLSGSLQYNTDLFDSSTIARMADHFKILLEAIVTNPDQPVSMLPIMTGEELNQLLVEWNDTKIDFPGDLCIHQLFERQVEQTPDAVALIFEEERLTYRELNTRANKLARYLQVQGVKPETLVGICLERSLEMVVGLLAILKAGGAYVPLDPAYPKERLAFMLDDAQLQFLITEQRLLESLPQHNAQPICLDSDNLTISTQSDANINSGVTASNLAYLIYTSGSTGKPKAVMVEHSNLSNTILASQSKFQFNNQDVMPALASFAFDIFLFELINPLVAGATSLILNQSQILDIQRLVKEFDTITVLHTVPGLMRQIINFIKENGDGETGYQNLRKIFIGGDLVSTDLLMEMQNIFKGAEINVLYGPTEATIICTSHKAGEEQRGRHIIGKPLGNVVLRICDRNGKPVPVGVPAEIWIGGAGVTRGYLNRSELTAEKYVEVEAGRYYRSGDLGRYLKDGEIEFLGRIDQQVKIRGYRIELGEIEAALSSNEGVEEAVVVVREDRVGEKQLVAYLVCGKEQQVVTSELRSKLKERLPEYMIPAAFVMLDALPLSANGKLDRKALPAPQQLRTEMDEKFVAPDGPVEQLIAQIWAKLLGVNQIGANDNFFELGGHSLLATQVISRLQNAFRLELPLRALFENPTVAGLAQTLEAAQQQSAQAIGPIPIVSREQELALSFAQQRLWFMDQLVPQNSFYNMPVAVRLSGKLDVEVLERVINEIVRRHESLRTSFRSIEGRPVQVISEFEWMKMEVVDLREIAQEQREAEARRIAIEEAQRAFDLRADLLLRAKLVRMEEGEHLLMVTMHHIASDGWSVGILIREVALLYEAYRKGKSSPFVELGIQYADFAMWQRGWLQGEVLERQLSYWKKQLGGELPLLDLPDDRPRPALQTYSGAMHPIVLSKSLSEALQRLSRKQGATLFMTLLAAFDLLLHRYTGQQEILVGSVIANRNRAEIEELIGFFVNTLIMRVDISGEPDFLTLLERVREVALDAYTHQDLPFEKLIEELKPERDLSRNPLFQVAFSLQNSPMPDLQMDGLSLSRFDFNSWVTKFDLEFHIWEGEEGLSGQFVYNSDLFDAATIARMAGHFQILLEGIVADPKQSVSTLPLLTEPERHQLLVEWNDTKEDYSIERCIHELFEEQVERTPDAVALIFEEERLTYKELNTRANKLARYLQVQGVKPETLVGICLERSLEMVVGLLAILKAGGAYVPLDPAYPKERLAFMLDDSKPAVVLTQQHIINTLFDNTHLNETLFDNTHLNESVGAGLVPARIADRRLSDPEQQCEREIIAQARFGQGQALPLQPFICIDTEWEEISQQNCENLNIEMRADNLAYLIYTSGSQGKPKAVMVEHGNLTNVILASQTKFQFNNQDVMPALASFAFDIFLFELMNPLVAGATSLILAQQQILDIENLVRGLEKITLIHTVPSLMNQVVNLIKERGNQDKKYDNLRKIFIGGDLVSTDLLMEMQNIFKGAEINVLYGPTEATIICTSHKAGEEQRGRHIIGKPLGNVVLRICDRNGKPVPVGVPAEIWIGGAGVTRGYLNRSELTAEKYVEVEAERYYRSGDLGRYLKDGEIEFLGRIDQQVKIRGYRIELGEIEAALSQHSGVEQAVVIAREDASGQKRLIAYLVSKQETAPTTSELRSYLKERLPEYMIPAAFVMLDALPLSANGKIDRKALPAPQQLRTEMDEKFVAPDGPVEQLIAQIWADLLGVNQIGANDNFFELGGHSLLATQVISRLQNAFRLELPLRALFENPTVAGLAQTLEAAQQQSAQAIGPIPIVSREQELALSFAQQRLWFMDQLVPQNSFYNMPVAVRLSGKLDVEVLERVINEIVRRHESLRTSFRSIEGRPVQVISEFEWMKMEVVDLREIAQEQREAEARRIAIEEAQRAFDLRADLLLRAKLVRMEEGEHLLMVTMHHIASDGWSVGILIREVALLYEAYRKGKSSPFVELGIQYADFAMWQRGWLQGEVLERQLSYWKKQLGGELPLLDLPTDRPRPPIQTFNGASHELFLSETLTEALKTLSRKQGVTLFMTLLAAFDTLLYRYTEQQDIIVGTPIANRNRAEVEGLIGFFVNTQVMRVDLSGGPSFNSFLERVREVTLDAYAHQDLPFEKLVEELQPERDMSRNPLFQVSFSLQNLPMSDLQMEGLSLSRYDSGDLMTRFDLECHISEGTEGLSSRFIYNPDLFDAATIARMADHFQILLESVTSNPEEAITELSLLGKAELNQLLVEWNDTKIDFPGDLCIHQLFERQVESTPDAIALIFEQERLSYKELNARANRLARYLQVQGVKPETLVGICLERSLEMEIGLLAILKAGGAYVPLDPAYPKERLAFMLDDAQLQFLITEQRLLESLPQHNAQPICLDSDNLTISTQSDANINSGVTASNLAYLIYTSGSTGKPKAVMVEHSNLSNTILASQSKFQFNNQDVMPALASFAFDIFLFELINPLVAGATSLILNQSQILDIQRLVKEFDTITVLHTVPGLMRQIINFIKENGDGETGYQNLRKIFIGGDLVSTDLLMEMQSIFKWAEINVLYGPTEATIICTSHQAGEEQRGRHIIGKPLGNVVLRICDRNGKPVPVGVPAEIWIGGAGVTRGYLNRSELTAEKYVEVEAERYYRSGDLGRYLSNGEIEFLGRIDQQVKIRGYRIELGEIEAALSSNEGVEEAVVVVREDRVGEKQLVAYLVCGKEQQVVTSELRSKLKQRLPEYMIPAAFVMLDALPLSANGKLDRKALPDPNKIRSESDGISLLPRDALEFQLTQIWEEILDVRPIKITDSFFDLGGHSLLAVQLMSRIQKSFGQNLPLSTLFQGATIEDMASILRRETDSTFYSPLVEIQPSGSKSPLFFVHPIGGTVLCYYELSRLLGPDQPFYGLQAVGVDSRQEPDRTVEQMATRYIEALRVVQPEGPYFLGGWSFGGVVAFEMAQQLQRQGEGVALLALLDSGLPTAGDEIVEIDDTEVKAAFAVDMAGSFGKDTSLVDIENLFKVFKTNNGAFLNYVPQVYRGRVNLFRATDRSTDDLEDQVLRWSRLTEESIEIYDIDCNHYTILAGPHVGVIAERLKSCLEEVGV